MEHVLKRFLNALILILLKASNGGGKTDTKLIK